MLMRRAFGVLAWVFLVSILFANNGHAATPVTSFGVTVVVQDTCIASVNGAAVEAYTREGALYNARSAVSVRCRYLTPYDVSMGERSDPGSAETKGPTILSGSAAVGAKPAPDATPQDRGHAHPRIGATGAGGVGGGLAQRPAYEMKADAQEDAPGPDADRIAVTITY
jgi:spore coat protein U-like protein